MNINRNVNVVTRPSLCLYLQAKQDKMACVDCPCKKQMLFTRSHAEVPSERVNRPSTCCPLVDNLRDTLCTCARPHTSLAVGARVQEHRGIGAYLDGLGVDSNRVDLDLAACTMFDCLPELDDTPR